MNLEKLRITLKTMGEYLFPVEKVTSYFKSINKQFIDEGFLTLIELPEYENMRQAYIDLQAQKEKQ